LAHAQATAAAHVPRSAQSSNFRALAILQQCFSLETAVSANQSRHQKGMPPFQPIGNEDNPFTGQFDVRQTEEQKLDLESGRTACPVRLRSLTNRGGPRTTNFGVLPPHMRGWHYRCRDFKGCINFYAKSGTYDGGVEPRPRMLRRNDDCYGLSRSALSRQLPPG
jgi:hypothetical protein